MFIENQTRWQRNIRKGIPRVAFIAAYIDPRTKLLTGIPPQDQEMVKQAVKQELINELIDIKLEEFEKSLKFLYFLQYSMRRKFKVKILIYLQL